jgi:hypothetical protein
MKKIFILLYVFFIHSHAEDLIKILDERVKQQIVPVFIEKDGLLKFIYKFNYDNNFINDQIIITRHNYGIDSCSIEFKQNENLYYKYSFNKKCTLSALRQFNKNTYIFLGDRKKIKESGNNVAYLEVLKFDNQLQKWYRYGNVEKDSPDIANAIRQWALYNIYKKPFEIEISKKVLKRINTKDIKKEIISKNIQTKKQPLYKTPPEKTKMYLLKDDKIEILKEQDDWLYILYKGKKDIKAWIPKSAVK